MDYYIRKSEGLKMTIEEAAKKLKKEKGNKYVKNNDLLWYLIIRVDDIEKRTGKTESMQKLMLYIVPILIAGVAVIVRLI